MHIVRGASFLCFIKDIADDISAFLFLGFVKMGINICRCCEVGVTKESGHVQQRHVLIDEDACEGVA